MNWFILAVQPTNPLVIAMVAILLFLVCAAIFFYFGVRSYLNKRKMEITPTSKANAVAPGLVELTGIAKSVDGNQRSPIFGKECAYYKTIIERFTSGKGAHWKEYEYARKESNPRFLLRDESGLIMIDSTGAEKNISYQIYSERGVPEKLSEPCKKYLDETLNNPESQGAKYRHVSLFSFRPTEYRITEYILEPGHQLYALGTAKIPDFQLPPGLASDLYICKGDADKTFIIAESSEKNALGSSNIGILAGAGGAIGMLVSVLYALVGGQAVISIILLFMMLAAIAAVLAAPSFLKKMAEKPPETPKNP